MSRSRHRSYQNTALLGKPAVAPYAVNPLDAIQKTGLDAIRPFGEV
jgi:hypothetical protein